MSEGEWKVVGWVRWGGFGPDRCDKMIWFDNEGCLEENPLDGVVSRASVQSRTGPRHHLAAGKQWYHGNTFERHDEKNKRKSGRMDARRSRDQSHTKMSLRVIVVAWSE